MGGERLACALVVVISLACGGVAVEAPAPDAEAAWSDDLGALAGRLALPDGAVGARWTTSPIGVADPRVPGPTDRRLVAWVEVDPERWDSVEALYGAPRPAQGALTLPAGEAKVLPDALRPAPAADGTVSLPAGDAYPPDRAEKVGWRPGQVRRIGDGLLIVAISS